ATTSRQCRSRRAAEAAEGADPLPAAGPALPPAEAAGPWPPASGGPALPPRWPPVPSPPPAATRPCPQRRPPVLGPPPSAPPPPAPHLLSDPLLSVSRYISSFPPLIFRLSYSRRNLEINIP